MRTILEFAEEMKCSRQAIYDAMKSDKLDYAIKFNKRLLTNTFKNRNWKPKKYGKLRSK